MKTSFRNTALITMTLFTGTTITACGDDAAAKEVRNNMNETLDSVSTWSQQQWDDFTKSTSNRWDELKKRSAELKSKASEQGKELSSEFTTALDKADAAVQDLQAAGKSQWESLSTKANESLNTASERLDAAWEALNGDKNDG